MYARRTLSSVAARLKRGERYLREKGARQALERAVSLLRFRVIENCIIEPFHDRRLGIRTCGTLSPEQLNLPREQSAEYSATSYTMFKRIMKYVNITPGQDVFLDYGSGKGRVVILAALRSFRKVIGVEVAGELNAVARQHLQQVRKKLRCTEVEICTCNAADYVVPNEVTVIHMYNPFIGEILNRVVERIHQSLLARPRKITLIYTHPRYFDPIAEQLSWVHKRDCCVASDAIECVIYDCEL